MKKFIFVLTVIVFSFTASAQYWQQEVNYKIQVTLNDQNHTLKGVEEIEYINHSPDRLDFIWFHIWPNAYKNDQTAFARQVQRENEGKARFKKFKDRGYIDSLDFTVDGVKARFETDPEHIDVIKLLLPQPLAPGGRVKIKTPFYVDLPEYISRSGHKGQTYMICQWYPKPAVYDRKGWHAFPYLDQGEYYSDYGSFDVTITLPSAYIVGATGVLQNADEIKQYKEIGQKNVATQSKANVVSYKAPAGPMKSLNYKGGNIVDFAWFADKDFVIRYDTMQMGSGKKVDVFTYHYADGNKYWVNSTSYVKDGTRAFSNWLGDYPYPVVQAVEGPKNEMSGGMEYPMITLITSPDANEELLDAVITHEVGHNWFMCILGTNERTHAWMDEGLNSYYEFRYEAEKYRANSVFGEYLPPQLKQKPVDEFLSSVYDLMRQFLPMRQAIDIPAAEFASEEEYGLVTYVKTAIWLHMIEKDFGRERFDKAMKAYYEQWKFKHPYPEDLRAALEKELNADLSAYFDMLKQKSGF